jgi:hypothetical protein
MPNPSRSSAWAQLLDPQGFSGTFGPTTVERRSPWFMFDAATGCCHWDGPMWPYSASQTLTGMANLLIDYPPQPYVTKNDYYRKPSQTDVQGLEADAQERIPTGSPQILNNLCSHFHGAD